MAGLALLTLLALAWMGRRVRKHNGLGRTTRVVTRSAGALLLGLGGWFAGALVALIALPSVPVDAELLMIVSIAAPVALASYLAWRHPNRAATSRAGLSAAVAGALIGAWLGFTCATAMLAAVTTLVGAIAGTNLALIGCDIASETRRRRRTAQPPASDVPRELVLHGALR
jgi:hypothetical protein